MYAFYGFALIFYAVFFFSFTAVSSMGNEGFIALPFLLFHMLLMFGIPYFMMRRSVKILEQELEREIHFVVSKVSNKLKSKTG